MNSYVTQSSIGEWFGISSIKVGKILIAHGLKDRNGATQEAVRGGLAKQAVTKDGRPFWTWEATRVSKIIDKALGDVETPYIKKVMVQVDEALREAERHRIEGCDFLADLILEGAYEGIPTGLIGLIRGRLGYALRIEA